MPYAPLNSAPPLARQRTKLTRTLTTKLSPEAREKKQFDDASLCHGRAEMKKGGTVRKCWR